MPAGGKREQSGRKDYEELSAISLKLKLAWSGGDIKEATEIVYSGSEREKSQRKLIRDGAHEYSVRRK